MDKRALQILLNDYTYHESELRTSTPENFEYAKSKGLMFDDFAMSHQQANDWLFNILPTISKEDIVDLFLASLSSRRLDWRSGLPAYAVARVYPNHIHTPMQAYSYVCEVCGDWDFLEGERSVNLTNSYRLSTGGLYQGDLTAIQLAFYLEQFSKLKLVKPTTEDKALFWQIIEVIEKATDNEKATDLEKKLSKMKLIKSNKSERVEILETLALCGILETDEHKGFYNQYIMHQTRQQYKYNTDWGYPLRWWRGKDKMNLDALYFWFGER